MCEAWHEYSLHEKTYVIVRTVEGKEIQGFLYACDPETGNLGLLSRGPTIQLVFSENVTSVAPGGAIPDGTPTCLPARKEKRSSGLGCEAVLEGLRARRIEAVLLDGGDAGEKRISVFGGIATVRAPYTPEACRSTNENVLLRVKQVLREIYGGAAQ